MQVITLSAGAQAPVISWVLMISTSASAISKYSPMAEALTASEPWTIAANILAALNAHVEPERAIAPITILLIIGPLGCSMPDEQCQSAGLLP